MLSVCVSLSKEDENMERANGGVALFMNRKVRFLRSEESVKLILQG